MKKPNIDAMTDSQKKLMRDFVMFGDVECRKLASSLTEVKKFANLLTRDVLMYCAYMTFAGAASKIAALMEVSRSEFVEDCKLAYDTACDELSRNPG